jgi:hypothetical protein
MMKVISVTSGADPGFQVRGAHLKKLWRTFLGYFVWKTTILRQKIIFFPILGGGAHRVRSLPPGAAPERVVRT